MAANGNDFEIAKQVADLLKDIEKERQQRVLRWVAESLGLHDLGLDSTLEGKGGGAIVGPTAAELPEVVRPGGVDIKSFVDSKKPKSDVQFAAVVAYYYCFEILKQDRKDAIDAAAIQEAARLAGRRRLVKPLVTLNNAKNLGYLDSTERGKFRINSVGENLARIMRDG